MELKQGFLISIEGIDGSGKSSLAKAVSQHFLAKNIKTVLTKEPGDTELGKTIRTLVNYRETSICPKAEYLLFAADRAQHFEEVIIPALKQNKLIISDRMADSSIVYQGYVRGLEIEMIKKINSWAMCGIEPNLTIYLKIDLKTANDRIQQRAEKLTAFEKEKIDFTKKLIEHFDQLFQYKKNSLIIDGTPELNIVINSCIQEIEKWLSNQI
ncbi:MAG: Thymidylate kinase [candidate division TM6 bacterium GW2011_GWF2_32_72]|nr:MAG: Thymidylate kinase [candidate division TM6 bacterium GW2011_GWF2_32_72]